ncbi:ATP-binding protein [Streptomyces endophyticus]|uniref:ATP-binding protein n=1 Tax=Streptomyces endophyticus TaxID=714166 RepID=A0ABU6F5V7_9ACTN|nr:ATP-binding protein [Streptomyces endophyticus]MEB8339395.1 ATP-binding protein [Streptomyces endophyticus]
MSRLYGRDVLLDDLVPRLVGYPREEEHGDVEQVHRDDPPALLLTGPHGRGRTAVLDTLYRSYTARIPVAEVDCAQGAGAGEGLVGNTSQGADFLIDAAGGLCSPVAGERKLLQLPRLWTGLVAVCAWRFGDTGEQEAAQDRVGRLLTGCGLEARGSPAADRWVRDVNDRLPNVVAPEELQPVVDASVNLFTERYLTKKGQADEVLAFYAGRPGTRPDESPLVAHSRAFHQGGDVRELAEASLAVALLEDLRARYGTRWMRFNRPPRPLLLLDNVQTPPGARLLDQFLTHRVKRAGDPLVVVAAARGSARRRSLPDATHRTLEQVSGGAVDWQRPETGTPSAGLITIELSRLERQDIVTMLSDAAPSLRGELPRVVRRFTQGSPLGCGLLTEAVRAAPSSAATPGLDVGALQLNGQSVTRQIAVRLVPDPELRRNLTLFSVARDSAAARALATKYLPAAPDRAAVETARSHLRAEHGAQAPQPFVTDPFLRAVLVLELRRRRARPTRSVPTWSDLHELLRIHHERARQDIDALHHALAGGDAGHVVNSLYERFVRPGGAEQWLRDLWQVASAPHPPDTNWARDCRDKAGGKGGTEPAGDDVLRSVHRLLHAVWLAADPLTAPDEKLCERIRFDLELLSGRHVTGAGTLFDAAQEWHDDLRELRTPASARPAPGPEGSHGELH